MEEQEISLRELIEVLLKYRFIIVGITIVCVLISFIVSFYVLEPTYQAEAKIIVTDLKKNQPNVSDIQGIIDNYANYPNFTVESYKDQIKNPEILYKVREQLDLDPEEYSLSGLADLISVENPQNTNILSIKVKEKNPRLAADIANTLAANFSDFITILTQRQATKSLEYIKTQLEVEEENLNNVLLEYKTFLQQPRGVSELESEQASKIAQITDLKEQLSQLEINISVAETILVAAQKQLNSIDKTLVTKNSLSENPVLYNYVQNEKEIDGKEALTIEMVNEEINPNYIEIDKTINITQLQLAEYKAAKDQISEQIKIAQTELEQLQVELAEKKLTNDTLTRKVETAQKTYNAFMDKYEESRITQSGKIGENAVVISSEALAPMRPIAPRKALNVAIAGILGIMFGVLISFLRAYWVDVNRNFIGSKTSGI